jgi:hypothetical protein
MSPNDVKTTTDIPGERFGKKIFAIKVKMDDGREVNLPMIERFPSKNGFAFTEGHRFPLSYSGIGFELNFGGDGHAPIPDATDYSDVCGVRMPETIVNRAIKIFGRAVKEDKVLPSPEVVPSKAASMNTNIYE